ncbi:MAG TPA: type II CAAX endopeptidase family protein [Candidatus Sulfotelmatobacter sp.]|nr:type II CAAX endopeptidase family protein [Candidatus Sulfotelmatobacter sp.]
MSELETNTGDTPPTTPTPSAPDFSRASQPSYARTLFLGSDGLRPGWGFAFYLVMFFPLQRIAVHLAGSWNLDASGLWSGMIEELGVLLAALISSLVLARVERRPWSAYGLPPRQFFGKLFWIGAVWGFAGITLLILALRGLNVFEFGHLALHGVRIAKFAAFWGVLFLVVGLSEEFRFRGYSQFALTRGLGFWPSALLLSSVFGMIHLGNEGEDWVGGLGAACIGLFFCLTLRRTGSLWFAVGFHAAWDWGETFFYSVPDSGMVAPGHLLSSSLHGQPWLTGGTVGPEGSVLCFAVIALAGFAFHRAYPKAAASQYALGSDSGASPTEK